MDSHISKPLRFRGVKIFLVHVFPKSISFNFYHLKEKSELRFCLTASCEINIDLMHEMSEMTSKFARWANLLASQTTCFRNGTSYSCDKIIFYHSRLIKRRSKELDWTLLLQRRSKELHWTLLLTFILHVTHICSRLYSSCHTTN